MRILLPFVVLVALAMPIQTFGQASPPLPKTGHYFQMPAGADHYPNRVVMKVKPEYRGYCSPQGISLPPVQMAFHHLQASRIRKSFPNAQPPIEVRNRFGQRYVDLSLNYTLDYAHAAPVEDAVNLLLETGVFEYVEPVYGYKSLYDPSDPDTTNQYYLPLLRAKQAWDISKGDTNVVIGIVDTGTSFTHFDLAGKNIVDPSDPADGVDNNADGYIDNFRGWDFGGNYWNSPGDNDPSWCCNLAATDHGVLVSGPAGAATDNGSGIASLGFNCRLLPVKVAIDDVPSIYYGYDGVVYAADHGAHIINLSWGGGLRSRYGADAINYAIVNKGCMIVAAAGNTPADLDFFPASFPHVISCAGSQQNDAFWNTSSSFGTTYHYMVDLCAPSRDVVTTVANTNIGAFTGTSLGAPMVCGVAGLVKAQFPTYTMQQVAERVRVTADANIYQSNPAYYTEKMGRGRLDAYSALTASSPSVRILEVAYDDGEDGLVQVGDTLDVRVRFINYLDPVTNLTIDLSTPNFGQFEILHGNAFAGDAGTLDTVSTWVCPFQVVIRSGTPAGFEGYLRFHYTGSGYDDLEFYPLIVEPSYVNADANRIETSLGSTGRWGYTAFPSLNNGKGLVLDGVGGLMKDAGLLIGTDATHVSNNIENQNGNAADAHFTNVTPIFRMTPGPDADLEARTVYTDAGAGASALGITVDQRTYQWGLGDEDDFIIQEYRIYNNSATTPVSNAYAGLYWNMDVFWRNNNTSFYDTLARCIYNFTETYASIWDFGVSLLTPDSLRGYATLEDSFSYNIADKFAAISSPPQDGNLATAKIIQFAGAGPFTIAPNDTHIVAFALVVGDSITDLRSAVDVANDRYWCLVRGGMTLRPDLGPDILECQGGTPTFDAGAGFSSYAWNTGATTQTLTPTTSGEYWVRVTDANGCVDYDRIHVTLNPGLVGDFTYSPSQVFVGDTVFLSDTTAGSIEWCWDFGDGSNLCPILPDVNHVYNQPGTYQLTLYVGNGTCVDTVIKTLQVDTIVSVQAPLAAGGLSLWPVPARGQLSYRFDAPAQGKGTLRIANAFGQTVVEKSIWIEQRTYQGTLPTNGFAPGVYMMEIELDGRRYFGKMLIQ